MWPILWPEIATIFPSKTPSDVAGSIGTMYTLCNLVVVVHTWHRAELGTVHCIIILPPRLDLKEGSGISGSSVPTSIRATGSCCLWVHVKFLAGLWSFMPRTVNSSYRCSFLIFTKLWIPSVICLKSILILSLAWFDSYEDKYVLCFWENIFLSKFFLPFSLDFRIFTQSYRSRDQDQSYF